MSRPFLRTGLTLIGLSATGLLLIADSAEECPHEHQRVEFAVSENSCGSDGLLTLESSTDGSACEITVTTSPASTESEHPLGIPLGAKLNGSDLKKGEVQIFGTLFARIGATPDGGVEDGGTTFDAGDGRVTRQLVRTCQPRLQTDGKLKLECNPDTTPADGKCSALLTISNPK